MSSEFEVYQLKGIGLKQKCANNKCSEQFLPKRPQHKYCSTKCKNSKYYADHKDGLRIINKEYLRKRSRETREQVLTLLGNRCSNPDCPIPPEKLDHRCLQVDHIFNNGAEDRRKFAKNKGTNHSYWLHIRKEIENGSREYQLLCPYCNWLKRYEEHPHSGDRNGEGIRKLEVGIGEDLEQLEVKA